MSIDDAGRACAGVSGADLIDHGVPECPVVRIYATQMAVGNVVDILVEINACVPSLGQHVLINGLVETETFQCGADANELFAAFGLGACNQLGVVFVVALYLRHASEVAEVAPDELVTIEMFGHSPYLGIVALVVEHNHLALGNGREVGLDALGCPGSLVADEEPGHLKPDGFGVNTRQGFIDTSRNLGQRIGLP